MRLAQTHLAIGSALGGEAGARLAEKAALPTSPDTLLRRVKRAGTRSAGTPRLVGIDDVDLPAIGRHVEGMVVASRDQSLP